MATDTDRPLMPGQPDIGKLRAFRELTEKEHTPFYAGREDLIRKILESARRAKMRTDAGEDAAGMTWVLQGAPGAGKTSLLKEVGRDPVSRGCRPWEGAMPAVVSLPRSSLGSERETARRLAEGLLRGADRNWQVTKEQEASAKGGVDLGIFRLSVSGAARRMTAPPEANLQRLRELPSECWRRPLIVAVDEIQNVGIGALDVLEKLHLGEHGLPVVPVYAGLANSAGALDDIEGSGRGLTRIVPERTVSLGRLEHREARRAAERLLDECGIMNWRHSDIASRLATRTEGWPQHLHNGMRVLAGALLEAGGDMDLVSEDRVLQKEAEVRRDRHRKRSTPEMQEAPVFVARVMLAALREELVLHELLERMEDLSKAGARKSERLPEGTSARSFLRDHLVRKGALQEGDDGVFRCPIPCFVTHLIAVGGEGAG